MDSSSSSSDEEEQLHLEYWNNWKPEIIKPDIVKDQTNERKQVKHFFHFNKTMNSVSDLCHSSLNLRFGNFIPPTNIHELKKGVHCKKSIASDSQINPSQKRRKTLNNTPSENNLGIKEKIDKLNMHHGAINWKKTINLDWGERVRLNDTTMWNDGDLIWGMVKPGLFGHIKLWINEYGNICASAEGTISSFESSEMTLISITKTELLRKMLNISSYQWTSLCEKVEESKTFLKFEAFSNLEVVEKTPLEKLWFFLCKRRHFFPEQCMLVKLSGAVKYLKEFKIIPKLVVQEIRNIYGEPIS